MMTVVERYLRDAEFHALVDTLHAQIQHAKFTPTEIREAAMLAHVKFLESQPFGTVIQPGWEIFCCHANENPRSCPCPPTCGCRFTSMCRDKPQANR